MIISEIEIVKLSTNSNKIHSDNFHTKTLKVFFSYGLNGRGIWLLSSLEEKQIWIQNWLDVWLLTISPKKVPGTDITAVQPSIFTWLGGYEFNEELLKQYWTIDRELLPCKNFKNTLYLETLRKKNIKLKSNSCLAYSSNVFLLIHKA